MARATSALHTSGSGGHIRQFVGVARELLNELYKLRGTREEIERRELKPVYCIDNDILQLYLNPTFIGEPGERPNENGYGVVFPDDSREDAAKIAAVLADYLIDHLPGELPLLQLAPIAEEALEILVSIEKNTKRSLDWTKDFLTLKDKAVVDLVAEDKAKGGKDGGELQEIAALLKAASRRDGYEEAAQKILREFFFRISTELELVRFLSLVGTGTVLSSHTATLVESKIPAAVVDAMAGPRLISEMMEFNESKSTWASRLAREKSRFSLGKSIERDARGLALLEFVNKKIEHEKLVLLMISGDKALHKVLEPESEMYGWVINPRALLIEALEWRTEEPAATERKPFELSLSVLVSAVGDGDGRHNGRVDPPVRTLYRSAIDHWRGLKAGLPPARLFDKGSYQAEIAEIVGQLPMMASSEVEAKLVAIQQTYESENAKLWEEFEESTVIPGIGITQATRSKPRNPPTVILKNFGATRKLVLDLVTANVEQLTGRDLADRLNSIEERDARTGTERRYLRFLVLAMLSGASGDWRLASILAGRAIAYANLIREESKDSKIDGLEALFVLTQAERLLSTNEYDLDKALDLLTQCENLGRNASSSPPDEYDLIKSLRCRAERVSFAIAREHVAVWITRRGASREKVNEAMGAIARLRGDLENLRGGVDAVNQIKEILLSYLFTNAMQLVHLSVLARMNGEIPDMEPARSLYNHYVTAINNRRLHESYLMRFYHLYYLKLTGVRFSTDDRKWLSLNSVEQARKQYSVTAYDRRRFADLTERVG